MRWILSIALACSFAIASPARALADTPSYYPPVLWLPAADTNFSAGRDGARITTIVIHQTEGSYRSALSWFRRPGSYASAHYLIRASDGEIAQLVDEADTAFHAVTANPWTIGIEHEFDMRRGIIFTEVQYESSAALVCAIARHYSIPVDREHIVGHKELPDAHHGDPGPLWDWSYYMTLVRGCAWTANTGPGEPANEQSAAPASEAASTEGTRPLDDSTAARASADRPIDAHNHAARLLAALEALYFAP